MGDFNEVLKPSKVRGGTFCISRALQFADMLENCSMVDLGASSGRFTWHRDQRGVRTVSKKLDRAIADCIRRTTFPKVFVENLCRLHSGNHLILLFCRGVPSVKGVRPFRFEAAWSSHSDFRRVVRGAWIQGNHDVKFGVDVVKNEALRFNEEVFGNIFRRKQYLEARIHGVQRLLEVIDSARLCLVEKELQAYYNKVLHQEE